jgi:hypothetical protein
MEVWLCSFESDCERDRALTNVNGGLDGCIVGEGTGEIGTGEGLLGWSVGTERITLALFQYASLLNLLLPFAFAILFALIPRHHANNKIRTQLGHN